MMAGIAFLSLANLIGYRLEVLSFPTLVNILILGMNMLHLLLASVVLLGTILGSANVYRCFFSHNCI